MKCLLDNLKLYENLLAVISVLLSQGYINTAVLFDQRPKFNKVETTHVRPHLTQILTSAVSYEIFHIVAVNIV